MNEDDKRWTVKISNTNRLFLKSICEKDETYDSAITKLVKAAPKYLKKGDGA